MNEGSTAKRSTANIVPSTEAMPITMPKNVSFDFLLSFDFASVSFFLFFFAFFSAFLASSSSSSIAISAERIRAL